MFAKTPRIVQALLPEAIWRKPSTEKVIYLTFDDGPTPLITEQVLQLLSDYHAKGTFFCIGKNVELYPEIYSKILAQGHTVGNHTHNHLKGWKTSNADYFADIYNCTTVVDSRLFRPPYGRIKRSQYALLKEQFSIIMWDVLSWDFEPENTPEQCAKNVLKNVRNGSIVVFHDSVKAGENCLGALEIVLKKLTKQGFELKAL